MSGDLLHYLQKRNVHVTVEDNQWLNCILVQRSYSPSSHSFIRFSRQEIEQRNSCLCPSVNVLFEQVIGPEFLSDALAAAVKVMSDTIENHALGNSLVAKALDALVRAVASLSGDNLRKMGSRNAVFWSSCEKDGVSWCEIGTLEIRERRPSSLSNILQKRLVVYDVSLHFFKACEK